MTDEICLPCAKEVIDNASAVGGLSSCASATVAMYAALGVEPTTEEAAEVARHLRRFRRTVEAMNSRLAAAAAQQ